MLKQYGSKGLLALGLLVGLVPAAKAFDTGPHQDLTHGGRHVARCALDMGFEGQGKRIGTQEQERNSSGDGYEHDGHEVGPGQRRQAK